MLKWNAIIECFYAARHVWRWFKRCTFASSRNENSAPDGTNLNCRDMTAVGGFSDSQESALFDEATYRELQSELQDGPIYPALLTDDVMEHEEKVNIMYVQPQQATIPVLDEFPGRCNFQINLNSQGTGKHCVYSESLQKIFINMEQTLPLRFEWEPTIQGLLLRTTMVFSLDQYRSDPVTRCHNHMATRNASNLVPPEVVKHVVRCLHPGSMYEDQGSHLSVVAPLGMPQAGSDYVPMNFQFFCKNSCTSGMNRRPTELVFTLETPTGEVLGRRRLPVRVCSCPKRDKEKEEAEHQYGNIPLGGSKKRKLSIPAGKKLLVPTNIDSREFTVQFKIPGKENYQAVLKHAFDVLAGYGARTGQSEHVRPYMEELLHKMQ